MIEDRVTHLTSDEFARLEYALEREPQALPQLTKLLQTATDGEHPVQTSRSEGAASVSHMDIIDRAREFAIAAHHGQTDKAGADYWTHPERVAEHVRQLYPDAPDAAVAAAWLHDVVEDTDWTADALVTEGFPAEVVDGVILLTRSDGVSSDDYYRAIRERGGIALMVKHADIADNTDPARLAKLEPELATRLQVKYAHARELLGLDG